jgi:hypothetical protein
MQLAAGSTPLLHSLRWQGVSLIRLSTEVQSEYNAWIEALERAGCSIKVRRCGGGRCRLLSWHERTLSLPWSFVLSPCIHAHPRLAPPQDYTPRRHP